MKDTKSPRRIWHNVIETKSAAWVDAILPFYVALGPVGTLIQLLILNLHGTVIDVALAITLFNAVGVPAALVWGFVTDRFQRRKLIIVASYSVCVCRKHVKMNSFKMPTLFQYRMTNFFNF